MFDLFGRKRKAAIARATEDAERLRIRQANAELAELTMLAAFSDEERAIMAEYRAAKTAVDNIAMTNAANRSPAELQLMDFHYQQAMRRYMDAGMRYQIVMQKPRDVSLQLN